MVPSVLVSALLFLPAVARASDPEPVVEGVIERDNDTIIDMDVEPETPQSRAEKIAEAERQIRELEAERDARLRPDPKPDPAPTTRQTQAPRGAGSAPDGRVFRTNQDRVNYELCQKGHSAVCGHIRYLDGAPAANPSGGAAGGSTGGSTRGSSQPSDGDAKTETKKEDSGPSSRSGSAGGSSAGAGAGGGASSGGGAAGGKSADENAAKTAEAAERAKAVSARAGAMGEQLKKFSADTMGGPAGGPGGAGRPGGPGGGPGAGGAAGGGRDLEAAAASGFAASFAAAGLKMGSGPTAGKVLRADGSPATADDVARLRAQIASDPAALARRPDFFNVVGRDSFGRLKGDFHGKPEARDGVFRHVGLTEKDRDFQRTESCNPKLEKECSTASEEPYKKGEFVSPEDLKAIEDALRADEAEEAAELARAAGEGTSAAPNGEEAPRPRKRRRTRPMTPAAAAEAAAALAGGAAEAPGREYRPPRAADLEAERAAAADGAAKSWKYPMRQVQTGALIFVAAVLLWKLWSRRRKPSFLEGNR